MGYYLTQVTQESSSVSTNKAAQQHGKDSSTFLTTIFSVLAFPQYNNLRLCFPPPSLHNSYCSSYLYTTWPQPDRVPCSLVSPCDLPWLPFGQNPITTPFLNNPGYGNRINIICNQLRFSILDLGRIQSHLTYLAALLLRGATGKYPLDWWPNMSITTCIF